MMENDQAKIEAHIGGSVSNAGLGRTKAWAEKDCFGTVRIKMQHEGGYVFDFITIAYNYSYTSNAHQEFLVDRILELITPNVK